MVDLAPFSLQIRQHFFFGDKECYLSVNLLWACNYILGDHTAVAFVTYSL